MSDLISRKALCEYALNQKDKSITPNDIMRFPSAQSQRKGRWESGTDLDREWCICSECFHQQYDKTNYCPNCGARMDGE